MGKREFVFILMMVFVSISSPLPSYAHGGGGGHGGCCGGGYFGGGHGFSGFRGGGFGGSHFYCGLCNNHAYHHLSYYWPLVYTSFHKHHHRHYGISNNYFGCNPLYLLTYPMTFSICNLSAASLFWPPFFYMNPTYPYTYQTFTAPTIDSNYMNNQFSGNGMAIDTPTSTQGQQTGQVYVEFKAPNKNNQVNNTTNGGIHYSSPLIPPHPF